MSKIKKVLAMVMTLAMILAMGMTSFAADGEATYTSQIKVSGLAAGESKTVNLYPAITLNADKNAWVVADWAKPYIELQGNKYVITNAAGLTADVSGTPITQANVTGTEATFNDVPVGAYVVTATGDKASYAPMVAETYKEDATYMTAENVELVAKTDGYDLDKKQKEEAAGGHFVGRGETINFQVTTTFPSFTTPDNSYTIVDTPTGLDILEVTSVTIGGETVTLTDADKVEVMNDDQITTKSYTIDLSDSIGTTNANAGKTVVVEYSAKVMTDAGYKNTANAYRDGVSLGDDDEEGFTGDITFTKYDEKETKVLSGAEFTLAKKVDGVVGNALAFIKVSDGVYKLAMAGEADATTNLVATNGTLKLTGLDEGTYHFTETKAPEGYSINEAGSDVEVVANDTAHVSVTGKMTDTKLSSLPGTGGIGTTIFTIGGCLIMIAAAALFFASRKKADK